MDRADVVDFLTKISSYDRRTVDETDIAPWMEFFGANEWITRPLALEAVRRHFDSSTEWLKPAHVKQQARMAKDSLERDAARMSALTPGRRVVNPSSFRARDPGRWDALFEEGRVDGAVERARRRAELDGIPRGVAESWAREWITARVGAEARGVPDAVPGVMPWPPEQ